MKITMLESVEDANEFHDADEIKQARKEGLYAKRITLRTASGQQDDPDVRSVVRVDMLDEGKEYDLPESQAKNLIRLKVAKAVAAEG